MTRTLMAEDGGAFFTPSRQARWKRRAVLIGVPAGLALLLLVVLWNTFFRKVPPGMMLVIIAKNGADLEPGHVLAREGQKGIQEKVLGEGWHFVTPIIYTTEVHPNRVIP